MTKKKTKKKEPTEYAKITFVLRMSDLPKTTKRERFDSWGSAGLMRVLKNMGITNYTYEIGTIKKQKPEFDFTPYTNLTVGGNLKERSTNKPIRVKAIWKVTQK